MWDWLKKLLGLPPNIHRHIGWVSRGFHEKLTWTEYEREAKNYRAVGDHQNVLDEAARNALRTGNPEIIITHYLPTVGGSEELGMEHPDWVVRDAEGNPCTQLNADYGVLLNPGHPDVRNRIVGGAKKIVEAGFDGPMMDEMCMSRESFKPGFKGINPQTGEIWTVAEFRAEQLKNAQAVRASCPNAFIVANSIRNGDAYFRVKPFEFAEVCNALVAEGYRGHADWDLDTFMPLGHWDANVRLGEDLRSRGCTLVAHVEYDKQAIKPGEEVKKTNYDLFLYCTFLLGLEIEHGSFGCTIQDRTQRPTGIEVVYYDYWEIDLGSPRGGYYKQDIAWREFQRGYVYVNPHNVEVEVGLPGRLWDLQNQRWIRQMTMAPHSGRILLK